MNNTDKLNKAIEAVQDLVDSEDDMSFELVGFKGMSDYLFKISFDSLKNVLKILMTFKRNMDK